MAAMLDWDDLRYFLAVARAGNLSAAARSIGTTQPTMGRRIDGFEKRLGARLFLRTPAGFALTETGQAMFANARRMEEEALAAQRVASGRDAGLAGTVRITSPEWFASRVLAPMLAAFCARHSGVVVDLAGDSRWLDLARGEAEIALRFARFEQNELVQRRIGTLAFGLYASAYYLERQGTPDFTTHCAGHALVTTAADLDGVADAVWLRHAAASARIAFRSSSRETQAAAAIAGAGMACLARVHGDALVGLVRIPTPTPVPPRPLWLGLHADTRDTPRVRAVADFLATEIRRTERLLDPDA
jgi:DNA-binding transcriptional LysR family regulator